MIERYIVENYKSIQFADVHLQDVNLLIGPNNSGKSNFLKSIIHLYNSFRREKSSNIFERTADVFLTITDQNKEGAKTDFKLILLDGNNLSISNKTEINLDEMIGQWKGENNNRYAIYDYLKNTRIYKPDFSRLTYPYPIFKNDEMILDDASNIASFLQTCLNKYRGIFNKITEDIKKVLPVFEEIVIDNVEPAENNPHLNKETNGKTFIQLGLKDVKGNIIWANELSEGAIYFMALLCIVHQPNPPKLLMLEEPERGIHPRRIKEVIDLVTNLSTDKGIQVIITTHSPIVVDLFEDEPEKVFVFEMKDGFTGIRNLKSDIIDPVNKELSEKGIEPQKDYGTSLGEKWVYGFLGGVPV